MAYKLVVVWGEQMKQLETDETITMRLVRDFVWQGFDRSSAAGPSKLEQFGLFGRITFVRTADRLPVTSDEALQGMLGDQLTQSMDVLILSVVLLEPSNAPHAWVVCDGCQSRIEGAVRWKCMECSTVDGGFDLCSVCEEKFSARELPHDEHHFVKLLKSDPDNDRVTGFVAGLLNRATEAEAMATEAQELHRLHETAKASLAEMEANYEAAVAKMDRMTAAVMAAVTDIHGEPATTVVQQDPVPEPMPEPVPERGLHTLAQALLKLEVGISWAEVVLSFRERRPGWMAEVNAATTVQQLAELLTDFYGYLRPELRNEHFAKRLHGVACMPADLVADQFASALLQLNQYLAAMGAVKPRPDWWYESLEHLRNGEGLLGSA